MSIIPISIGDDMKELFEKFKLFDIFIRDQLLLRLVLFFVWTLISPIIHKLQGMLWTTSLISFYLICTRSAGLFVPYFKGMGLKKIYVGFLILDTLYIIATSMYFWSPFYFLWMEVFLSVLFLICSELFSITFNLYIVEKYGKEIFEDVSYCSSLIFSIAGISGFATVMVTSYFMEEWQSIVLFISLLSMCLILQILNYFKHYIYMEDK